MVSKLVIIRGNSGSVKTTIAQELRQSLGNGSGDNTMLVQQDVLRRDMLRERDMPEKQSIIELIKLIVEFGRRQRRIVILEGILAKKKYGKMLQELIKDFDEAHVYYFDLPFEETLKRHVSKPNAHEFGENEMREWWNEKDYLGVLGEKVLGQELSAQTIVDQIIADVDTSKDAH